MVAIRDQVRLREDGFDQQVKAQAEGYDRLLDGDKDYIEKFNNLTRVRGGGGPSREGEIFRQNLAAASLFLTEEAAEKAREKMIEYLDAVGDVIYATGELAEALGGSDGLAHAFDVTLVAFDSLMVYLRTGDPVLAVIHLVAKGIMKVAEMLTSAAKKAQREADEMLKSQEEATSRAIQALEPFAKQMADAIKANNFDDFGQALKDKLDDQILNAIIEATALSGNSKIIYSMDRLTEFLADGLQEDEIPAFKRRRDTLMRQSEEALQDTKRQLELAGITFGDQGAAAVEAKRKSGLSVAIKQITTRQADELAFVLRTTQGLSQQIAINTDRSANSLEEWLPFISERLDSLDRLPAAGATPNAGGAEGNIIADRAAAGANFLGFQVAGLPPR